MNCVIATSVRRPSRTRAVCFVRAGKGVGVAVMEDWGEIGGRSMYWSDVSCDVVMFGCAGGEGRTEGYVEEVVSFARLKMRRYIIACSRLYHELPNLLRRGGRVVMALD